MQLAPPFSSTYFALMQESLLSESSIYSGLTELKGADMGDKGRYYSAFFNLAIGIERLLKIILALDHAAMAELQSPKELPLPGEAKFREWGHNLLQMHALVCTAAVLFEPTFEDYLSAQPIAKKTLVFLNKFNRTSRYFNLNALGGDQRGVDPLAQWSNLLDGISTEVVSDRQRRKIRFDAELISSMMQPHIIIEHNLSQQGVSLTGAYEERKYHAIATNHVTWHLCKFIYGLRSVLEKAALRALQWNRQLCPDLIHIPSMDDFCRKLLFDQKSWVFRKRRWP